jgi:hypothetical protein
MDILLPYEDEKLISKTQHTTHYISLVVYRVASGNKISSVVSSWYCHLVNSSLL